MANTSGEKELKTNYPIEEGLIAGTTKQTGRTENLNAGVQSFIPEREKVGL